MNSNKPSMIDLSHPLRDGLITHKGLPGPKISDFLTFEQSRSRYAAGVEFHIGRIEMVASTGTYIDAPYHRYPDGPDVSELDLAQTAGLPGLVVDHDPSRSKEIGPDLFRGLTLKGRAVLVRTGLSVHFGRPAYSEDPPFLTREAAELLVESEVALLGVDFMNVDDTRDPDRPVHSRLLARGAPIVENLNNLNLLPEKDFLFFAAPVKVSGLGSFPVRAMAMVFEEIEQPAFSGRQRSGSPGLWD